ncbi:unnamed protein product, partial [Acanthoscelides obtectus]
MAKFSEDELAVIAL